MNRAPIDIVEKASDILRALRRGVLVTSKANGRANSMVVEWGTLGFNWGKSVFVCYVRESRFTRELLDANAEFTVNLPVGLSEILDESIADFAEAIILAVVLTLLTLAAILESWRKPLLVLLTVPMSLIGVLWALKLGGLSISIFVLLGVVMLIGVVVNPAVLIVDAQTRMEKAGVAPAEAICRAVAQTFRAVVMVIVASGLGMLPIALSTGIGAVNRIGIGAASVGGILVAGALTLLLLPFLGMGRR